MADNDLLRHPVDHPAYVASALERTLARMENELETARGEVRALRLELGKSGRCPVCGGER